MPTLTTLINFDGTNGQGPYGLVLDANGNLLGTTGFGGGGVRAQSSKLRTPIMRMPTRQRR